MAIRTTTTLMGQIIRINTNLSTEGAIAAANRLVDQLCLESGYTDAHLTEIETWLAAHFYSVVDRATRPQMESAGRGAAQVTYFGKVGMYLSHSVWGQQAIALDTEGNLAAWQAAMEKGKPRTASLTWIGNDPTEVL